MSNISMSSSQPGWFLRSTHSLRQENISTLRSQSKMLVKVLRPSWLEDETVAKAAAVWKFATLWEHPLGKGEATCHSSPWCMVLCTEDVWKATTRVPRSNMTRMVENTLLVAEGICITIFY